MPALPFELGSKTIVERSSQVRFDEAVDGTLRTIDRGATTYRQISCVVEALDDTDAESLEVFLDTNETMDIDVTVNGVSYRGRLLPSVPVAVRVIQARREVSFALWARRL
ncbi:MAG: hypothetical protein AAGI72_15550 [Pseudomonadota bacterium]